MQTMVMKWGNSSAVRLNKAVLDAAGLREKDTVDVNVQDGSVVIRKVEPAEYRTLDELFEGYEGGYVCGEADFSAPVGNEVW